jgi:hypothetical protein
MQIYIHSMSKMLLRLFPEIIIIVLVVSWGIALVAGYIFDNGEPDLPSDTPAIIMNYQKTAPDTYTFTVFNVIGDDVLWSDIQGVVNPSGPILTEPTNGYVGAGDSFVISNMEAGASYSIVLIYKPNGNACYQTSFIAV